MKEKILHLLSDIRPEFDFSESSNFVSEGLLDSFDVVQLVTALDEEYNISIDGMDILPENFVSIDAITDILIKNGVAR
jgi:acyl carrier protein